MTYGRFLEVTGLDDNAESFVIWLAYATANQWVRA